MVMVPENPQLLWIVITTGFSCAILAISIGANDVANSFSASIGSGALKLRIAIPIAFVFEIIGSISLGGSVSDSIRKRIVRFAVFADAPYELALGMMCSALAATCVLLVSTFFGMPVSTTHSIIGALAGFGLASGRFNAFQWIQLLYIVISWLLVPICAVFVSALAYIILQQLVLKRKNSFVIMKRILWLMLTIYSIPLAVFITFQNSYMRAAVGATADRYRAWFKESTANRVAIFVIALTVLSTVWSSISYTVAHFRVKSGWSYLESLKSFDRVLENRMPAKKDDEEPNSHGVEGINPDLTDSEAPGRPPPPSPEESHPPSRGAPRLPIPTPEASGERSPERATSRAARQNPDTRITLDPKNSMEMNIDGGRVEIVDVTSSSFSKSIVDSLLSSMGFSRTKTASHSSLESRDTSSFYGKRNIEFDVQGEPGPRMNRFLSNKGTKGSASQEAPASFSKSELGETTHFSDFTPTPETENIDKTQLMFSAMQVVSATMSVIAHSANDTANAVSPFATVLYLYRQGIQQHQLNTPWYVLLLGGSFMAIGLALFGYKVIKTVGMNITRVTPSRGFIIDATAGCIVSILSHVGVPLSSTHVAVSSILGVGMVNHVPFNRRRPSRSNSGDLEAGTQPLAQAERSESAPTFPKRPFFVRHINTSNVNLKLYRKIFFTWIITVFTSGLVSAVFTLIARLIYHIAT